MDRERTLGQRNPIESEAPLRIDYLDKLPEHEFQGRVFVVRVDYNDQQWGDEGNLIGDRRFRASIPTIEYILDRRGKVVLLTHQGRPEPGKNSQEHNLLRIAEAISSCLNQEVTLLEDKGWMEGTFNLVSPAVQDHIARILPAEICLLGNSRFDPREQSKDSNARAEMAMQIASIADYFVLDGFPIAHRNDTTVTELPKYLRSFGGFWLKQETEMHQEFLRLFEDANRRRFVAIFGGIKPDKLELIQEFCGVMKEGDCILLAGTLQHHVKDSVKGEIIKRGIKIVLQADSIEGRDIGPLTLRSFLEEISDSELVFWNGPLGKFEQDRYSQGTTQIARQLRNQVDGQSTKTVFISGGETSFAVSQALRKTTNGNFVISTGGGASIAFFANRGSIPGMRAIALK